MVQIRKGMQLIELHLFTYFFCLSLFFGLYLTSCKRIRDASRYTIKKISLKFLFLSDIFLFPYIRQQVTVLA